MLKTIGRTLLAVLIATTFVFAQDPLKTLPNAYKLDFENAYVKVVRVHYEAGAKLPDHTHDTGTTAYVYLNDSEGIVFRHTGKPKYVVKRQAVKAGAIRVAYGPTEEHEVENTSTKPCDFVRVLLKTDRGGPPKGIRLSPTENEFVNGQLRITRLHVAPQKSVAIEAKDAALIVEVPSGKEHWVDAGKSQTLSNQDKGELALVRIDFLTKPK